MYNCSYGINMWVFLTGLSSDMVSLMGPYSWTFCSICNAYADWGVLVLYVSGVFAMSYCQSSLIWPMYDFLQVLHVRFISRFCLCLALCPLS